MRKIIAVDFDGTLCEHKYPLIGNPKIDIIKYIKKLKEENCILVLWTCRAGQFLKEAVEWCKEQEIEMHYVNENVPNMVKAFGNDCRKIFADMYLDDRAINVKEIENNGNER